MPNLASLDEVLNEAFQLAYLIIGDRATAIRITLAAMDNLKVAAAVQGKRNAYLPAGRSAARGARTKISLSEIHILQRLIYIEAEIYERLLEQQAETISQEDLLIHFIKHLVRITTKRNSFYVSLGLSRLLYNYPTAEATEIYNLVVQDPDRMRDDYYYRSRKRSLMTELKERFGALVKTHRNNRQEERFQSQADSLPYAGVVKACLLRFTPWFTECVLPENFDPTKQILSPLLFRGIDPDEEHAVELNRLHTLLHPVCYERLIVALGFASPNHCLEAPYFFISGGEGRSPDDRFHPPPLTESERNAIKNSLDGKTLQRQRLTGDALCVQVDGVEQMQLPLRHKSQIAFPVEEGAEVVQVCALTSEGTVLLATHLLRYDEAGLLPANAITRAGGGREVRFRLVISEPSAEEPASLLLYIEYRENRRLSAFGHSLWQGLFANPASEVGRELPEGRRWQPALLLLLLLVALAGVLIYWQATKDRPQPPVLSEQDEKDLPSPLPANRNAGTNQPLPSPSLSLPPSDRAAPDGEPLAINPQPQIPSDGRTTRSAQSKLTAAKLLSITKVYVDPLGEATASQSVRQSLVEQLQSSPRFRVVENRNEADAVFKGRARPISRNPEQASVQLQLVNIEGQILWPLTTEKLPRRYQGEPQTVAAQLLRDLLDDIQRLERQR